MSWIAHLGERASHAWGEHQTLWATAATLLRLAAQPRRWPQPVRNILARQILFTGFDALRIVSSIAILIGFAVVLQTHVALTRLGQSAWIGPILVAILVREAGPLLVNFIVIARSGTAISAELASMQVAGEVRVLDGMGLDPLPALVLPRAIGTAISVFCLTLVFL
ncbi:MAG: ABC transporter permease, partial [Kiritimatiellia bacterium]|nr:ABC transporter permease [Kiritimatiellia bacterium]